MAKLKRKSIIHVLVIYYSIFLTGWAVIELWSHEFLKAFSDPTQYWLVESGVFQGIVKVVLWVVPAIWLIKIYQQHIAIDLTTMFKHPARWNRYIVWFVIFTAYILCGAFITRGKIDISPEFVWPQIIAVLFVGITEELVFRGWLLNATVKNVTPRKQWIMILVNALLFLMIHFPYWLSTGQFVSSFTSLGFLCIIALSVLFSKAFLREKSLLVPIVLHTYWDLLMVIFM